VRAIERAGYLAYGRTREHLVRRERALALIVEGLARCQAPYVAFSGGKDSSALLHLVLQVRSRMTARILTSGETRQVHGNIDVVLDWWRQRYSGLELQEICVDRVWSDEWADADWTAQRKAGRRDIAKLLPGGHDGAFLGLRDEESNARRMATRKYGPIRRHADGLYVICPLFAWRLADVGAVLAECGAPLLSAYEAEGLDARTTMRLTGDAVRQGGVVHLRMRDKAAYNALIRRFPELREWDG